MSRHSFPIISYSKCRDMAFSCRYKFGYAWGSYVMTKHFYVATELAKVRGKSVMTEPIYVATKLAKARGKCVAIELVYVATDLATTESSVAHDRAGCAQVKCTR